MYGTVELNISIIDDVLQSTLMRSTLMNLKIINQINLK